MCAWRRERQRLISCIFSVGRLLDAQISQGSTINDPSMLFLYTCIVSKRVSWMALNYLFSFPILLLYLISFMHFFPSVFCVVLVEFLFRATKSQVHSSFLSSVFHFLCIAFLLHIVKTSYSQGDWKRNYYAGALKNWYKYR